MSDPKYFKNVKVGPSAVVKMMMHGQQGIENGIKRGGKPIEVMGLLLGRPGTEDPHSFVITDAQALPIEGFETKVIADDENVINYMIELGESLEISRKERFCGWYHTHPFDLDKQSHCFLSNTDISTQLQWQRSEDPHGNPWLALVIDPLYSLHHEKPEIFAFRVYPPDYTAPANETPDGTIVAEDKIRVAKWGACWNRYYKLNMEYYISSLAQSTLGVLNDKFSWQKQFTNPFNVTQEAQEKTDIQIDKVIAALSTDGRRGGSQGVGSLSLHTERDKDKKSQQNTVSSVAADQMSHHIAKLSSISVFNASSPDS